MQLRRYRLGLTAPLTLKGTEHEGLLADWSGSGAGVRLLPEQMRGLEPGVAVRLGPRREARERGLDGTVVRLILVRDHAGQALFKAGIRLSDPPERVSAVLQRWLEPEGR